MTQNKNQPPLDMSFERLSMDATQTPHPPVYALLDIESASIQATPIRVSSLGALAFSLYNESRPNGGGPNGAHITTDYEYAEQFAHELVTGGTGGSKTTVRRQDRQVNEDTARWLANTTKLPVDALYPAVIYSLQPAALDLAQISSRGRGQSLRVPRETCYVSDLPVLDDFLQGYFFKLSQSLV